jgi:hypothetical protein
MDADFIVRTVREGTVNTNDAIEKYINTMGGDCFTSRVVGFVTAIVEKTGGKITKKKLRWSGDDFKKVHEKNATIMLDEMEKVVAGGGNDEEELRVKVVAKK